MPGIDQDSLDFKTGLFGLRLAGPNALIIFLFISLLGVASLTVWSSREASREHQEIVCMIKLNLYVNSIPRGDQLDWQKLPVDLYGCVPRFLYERGTTR